MSEHLATKAKRVIGQINIWSNAFGSSMSEKRFHYIREAAGATCNGMCVWFSKRISHGCKLPRTHLELQLLDEGKWSQFQASCIVWGVGRVSRRKRMTNKLHGCLWCEWTRRHSPKRPCDMFAVRKLKAWKPIATNSQAIHTALKCRPMIIGSDLRQLIAIRH